MINMGKWGLGMVRFQKHFILFFVSKTQKRFPFSFSFSFFSSFGFWGFFGKELVKHAKMNGLHIWLYNIYIHCIYIYITHTHSLVLSHAIKAGEKEQSLALSLLTLILAMLYIHKVYI